MSDAIVVIADAATSPTENLALGAFLCLAITVLQKYTEAELAGLVVYHKYTSKKSTWCEIKNIIDALNFIRLNSPMVLKVEIYTDCQSICDLLGRRKEKLQKNNFKTHTGKTLENAELYKELYSVAQFFQLQTFKIKGHAKKSERITVHQKIFAVLDNLCRQKLRSSIKPT